MTEVLAPQDQSSEQYEDPRDKDSERARAMAIASNRNELNRVAFKVIASEHMKNPDLAKSPLRAVTGVVKGKVSSPTDPSVRVVEAQNFGGGIDHTADSAIIEAQKERVEADKQAQIAADRYDALKKL